LGRASAPSASGGFIGGPSVTLTVAGFSGAMSVTFGGPEATSLVVVGNTEATVVTPSSPPGAVDVPVTTPYRTATLPNGFTFSGCPPALLIAESTLLADAARPARSVWSP
jgi:IPT/TIG domain